MYELSSKYYDVIYSFKDYRKEAEWIREYLTRQGMNRGSILDVACGTGQHDAYLRTNYSIDGIDLNPEFIGIAQTRNPEGTYHVADMTQFQLDKKYDIIMCLFSSIGYVKTMENVIKTLERFKAHLNENGLILVEPWFTPEVWETGRVDVLTTELGDIKVCRMTYTEKQNRLSILRFDYLLGNPEGVEYFSEKHEMGLFTVDEMTQAFGQAGLQVAYDEKGIGGRGMYVGRKRG